MTARKRGGDFGGSRPPVEAVAEFTEDVNAPISETSQRQIIDRDMRSGCGLYSDAQNDWLGISWALSPFILGRLTPLKTYRKYLESSLRETQSGQPSLKLVDYIVNKSDRAKIAAYDRLVAEYNATLEKISQTQNITTKLKDICDRALQLF